MEIVFFLIGFMLVAPVAVFGVLPYCIKIKSKPRRMILTSK